jgi:CRP-like cAMP-binding protein
MTTLLAKAPTFLSPSAMTRNRLLGSIGSDALKRLSPDIETVTLSAGEELYDASWMNEYVYFPQTAVISHLHNSENGESVEIAMVGREGASGLCGFSERRTPTHTATVSVGGVASRIDIDILMNEAGVNPKVQTVLFDYSVGQLAQLAQRVACESLHYADQRLCSWLLMLNDRVPTNRMRITHEQISAFIGVNRPSVSVIAKGLKEQGLIDYVRGKILILDRRGLERSACECYSNVQALTPQDWSIPTGHLMESRQAMRSYER